MADATASLKVALVTGSNSGVGLALCVSLAKAGFHVWATMRSLEKGADLTSAATEAGVQGRITHDACDVSDTESVNASVGRLLAAHGRVDLLVNNAGYCVFGAVEFLSMEAMKAQFETNFFGVIRCQKAVLPTMRAQRSGKVSAVRPFPCCVRCFFCLSVGVCVCLVEMEQVERPEACFACIATLLSRVFFF